MEKPSKIDRGPAESTPDSTVYMSGILDIARLGLVEIRDTTEKLPLPTPKEASCLELDFVTPLSEPRCKMEDRKKIANLTAKDMDILQRPLDEITPEMILKLSDAGFAVFTRAHNTHEVMLCLRQ